MRELVRTNDWVKLSWLQALLRDAGIESLVLDNHASAVEGYTPLIQRRLAVAEDDFERAKRVLIDSDEELSI